MTACLKKFKTRSNDENRRDRSSFKHSKFFPKRNNTPKSVSDDGQSISVASMNWYPKEDKTLLELHKKPFSFKS